VRVHRHLGMIVRTEELCAFDADGPVAESRAFGGAGNDADVLGHDYTSFTKFAPNAIDGVSAPDSVDASTRSTAAMDDFTVKL